MLAMYLAATMLHSSARKKVCVRTNPSHLRCQSSHRALTHPLRVAAFVIIPRVDLHHLLVDDLRAERVDDARPRVIRVIRADQRLGLETENALERSLLGRLLQGLVDLLPRYLLVHLEDAVGERRVEQWNAHGEAV